MHIMHIIYPSWFQIDNLMYDVWLFWAIFISYFPCFNIALCNRKFVRSYPCHSVAPDGLLLTLAFPIHGKLGNNWLLRNASKSVLLKNQANPESNKKIQMTRNGTPVAVIAMEDEFPTLHWPLGYCPVGPPTRQSDYTERDLSSILHSYIVCVV